MTTQVIAEGKAPFIIQDVETACETWYKVFGDLTDASKIPLFVLHGGPAGGHEYLLSLSTLSESVILYDQIGCGRSTALLDRNTDESFWTADLFCDELSNLIAHLGLDNRPIDLLGHSWGGMLAATWASDPKRSRNLRRLVLYGSPASMEGHAQGLKEVRKLLPRETQEALERGLQNGNYTSEEYLAAMGVFSQNHLSLSKPFPCDEILPALTRMSSTVVHHTMFGPTTLDPSGSLRNWSSIPHLHQISAPTLLIRGAQEYIQESTIQPFFDRIPKIKWITFNDAAHFSHIEQRDKFFNQVGRFLIDDE